MTVHNNSRFKGSYIYLDKTLNKEDGGVRYISPFRDNIYSHDMEDTIIIFEAGMRIDILAYDYYGHENLDWVIMDANPQYLTPYEIKIGDKLVIPNAGRLNINV